MLDIGCGAGRYALYFVDAGVRGEYVGMDIDTQKWTDENLPEGFAVYDLPPAHRRRMRTTNMLERLNREIKRRTRVATPFPNEASLLRLVSALLAETSEEWETGKVYLTMETEVTER